LNNFFLLIKTMERRPCGCSVNNNNCRHDDINNNIYGNEVIEKALSHKIGIQMHLKDEEKRLQREASERENNKLYELMLKVITGK
jgi:hypothetical protein